ncbi:glycosyltransferase family protein [Wukongibacter sp. M2B1]|uniref:glycosyltransferase family protein n=1 Tax=Wukongibacter sp. M2B1 TaxID=3088895 RepID=UPI003D78F876
MDNRKICFIICFNDKNKYLHALTHIKLLRVPNDYKIEIVAIEDAKSMTEGYNRAMKKTDAKYKVYLHQDVYIINENFISDILKIFQNDIKVGMIGFAGSKQIPVHGKWNSSSLKYGKLSYNYNGVLRPWRFRGIKDEYESVKCVDGLMMVTQYDIPWREELFTGWHFYDVSQSLEFIKAGYKVVIPKMDSIWCIHYCILNPKEKLKNYEKYRQIFVKEYSEYLG